MIASASLQSARALAHSKTLRASRQTSIFAPAFWSAAALRRFPTRIHLRLPLCLICNPMTKVQAKTIRIRFAPDPVVVAQSCTLLYRRFEIGKALQRAGAFFVSAVGSAGWKPALRQIKNLRYGGCGVSRAVSIGVNPWLNLPA